MVAGFYFCVGNVPVHPLALITTTPNYNEEDKNTSGQVYGLLCDQYEESVEE